jgi:quercetin dioxygenase-like cupin family protein
MPTRSYRHAAVAAVAVALTGTGFAAGAADPAPPASPAPNSEAVKELLKKDLSDVPGKEVRLLTVEYLPGGASLPHRHNAQVFVYVLSGSVRMQVQGSPVVTLGPGQTFYEGRDDVHTVSANASRTKPAKILVFMVKDKDSSKESQ